MSGVVAAVLRGDPMNACMRRASRANSAGSKRSLALTNTKLPGVSRGTINVTAVVVANNADTLSLSLRSTGLDSGRQVGLVTAFLAIHRIDPRDGKAVPQFCAMSTSFGEWQLLGRADVRAWVRLEVLSKR